MTTLLKAVFFVYSLIANLQTQLQERVGQEEDQTLPHGIPSLAIKVTPSCVKSLSLFLLEF